MSSSPNSITQFNKHLLFGNFMGGAIAYVGDTGKNEYIFSALTEFTVLGDRGGGGVGTKNRKGNLQVPYNDLVSVTQGCAKYYRTEEEGQLTQLGCG